MALISTSCERSTETGAHLHHEGQLEFRVAGRLRLVSRCVNSLELLLGELDGELRVMNGQHFDHDVRGA